MKSSKASRWRKACEKPFRRLNRPQKAFVEGSMSGLLCSIITGEKHLNIAITCACDVDAYSPSQRRTARLRYILISEQLRPNRSCTSRLCWTRLLNLRSQCIVDAIMIDRSHGQGCRWQELGSHCQGCINVRFNAFQQLHELCDALTPLHTNIGACCVPSSPILLWHACIRHERACKQIMQLQS